ncbi:MAG: hypothetical protein J0M18_10725 [Ignavibacteria bacterium]|nr:hypothetical protein [Ignavibacteria bacterium]
MRIIQYCTYEDFYKEEKTMSEYYSEIYSIFSLYNKNTVLMFLSHFLTEASKSDDPFLHELHEKFLEIKINRPIVHRRSMHLLSQVFFSYNKFSKIDSRVVLCPQDSRNLFLCANSILNQTEGTTYKDISNKVTPIKILHNSIKFSNDLINNQDVRNIFYYYINFYKELKHSVKYEYFNSIVTNKTNLNIDKIIELLESLFLMKGKSAFNFLQESFTININDTFLAWENRVPKVDIPYCYPLLQTFPLIENNSKFHPVCSFEFMILSVCKKIYHTLRGINKGKDFGTEFGYAVEKVIIKDLTKSFGTSNCKIIDNLLIDLHDRRIQLGDFGILKDNNIFLFEIKSGMLRVEEKYENNIEKFENAISKRYIEKEGVNQQVKRILDLDSHYYNFCAINKLDSNLKYQVIPIIIFLDDDLMVTGFNRYIGDKFIEISEKCNSDFKNITCAKNNSAITLIELRSCIESVDNPSKILESLWEYNHNFDRSYISYFTFSYYFYEDYLKRIN